MSFGDLEETPSWAMQPPASFQLVVGRRARQHVLSCAAAIDELREAYK